MPLISFVMLFFNTLFTYVKCTAKYKIDPAPSILKIDTSVFSNISAKNYTFPVLFNSDISTTPNFTIQNKEFKTTNTNYRKKSKYENLISCDKSEKTKLYDIEEDETIVIDISKSNKKVSLNRFSIFNTESKKIIINNSKKKAKSSLTGKYIDANENYDSNDDIADTIIFILPMEAQVSNLSSSIEVLGGVKNLIFSNPNGIISNGGRYTNIKKLTLASGIYNDVNNISTTGKLTILPTNDEKHLGIDASEIDEVHLIAREIDITGETIIKGMLLIEIGNDTQIANASKPKYSFQTSSFGNIQAGSIKLKSFEPSINVFIVTSIITTIGNIDFNLTGNLLLNSNKAKLISEKSKLIIAANDLILENAATISSYNDMTLTLKHNLFNKDKSFINTGSEGNIIMQLQELRNYHASIIHSGANLTINCNLLENIGINIGNTHYVETEYTGLSPWRNTVPIFKDNIKVTLTTDPSLILSENNMKLNVDNLQNRGSNIISKAKLIINSIIINNERNSFIVQRSYKGEKDYVTDEIYIKWRHIYPEFYHKHRRDSNVAYNNELYYSNTPSLIVGNEIEMYVTEAIFQDSNNFHKDSSVDVMSRISSTNLLKIRAKDTTNYGIFEMGLCDIEIVNILSNVGGIIVTQNGGLIKTNVLQNIAKIFSVDFDMHFTEKQINGNPVINCLIGIGTGILQGFLKGNPIAGAVIGGAASLDFALKKNYVFTGDRVHFEDQPQPSLIGIYSNVKQLQIIASNLNGEGEVEKKDESGFLLIRAKQVLNVGSYILSKDGIMKIVTEKLLIVSQEITNRLSMGINYEERINNMHSGIFGKHVSFEVQEDALILGTDINLIGKLQIKARILAIMSVQNKITSHYDDTSLEVSQNTKPKMQADIIEIETINDTLIRGVDIKSKNFTCSANGSIIIENSKDKTTKMIITEKKTHNDILGKLTSSAAAMLTSIPSGPLGMAISGAISAIMYRGTEIETKVFIDENILRSQIEADQIFLRANQNLTLKSINISASKKDIQYGNTMNLIEDEEAHIYQEKTEKKDTDYLDAIKFGIFNGKITNLFKQVYHKIQDLRENEENSPKVKLMEKIALTKQEEKYEETIGSLSEKEESSKGGPGVVNAIYNASTSKYELNNKKDRGGFSYGVWQFETASNKTLDTYLTFLKNNGYTNIYKKLEDAGGFEGALHGTTEFIDAWKEIAIENPTLFRKSQYEFTYEHNYKERSIKSLYDFNPNYDLDAHHPIIKEVLWSIGVNHSPFGVDYIIKETFGVNISPTDEEFIKIIYEKRKKYIEIHPFGKPVETDPNGELHQRYDREMKNALEILGQQ